VWLFVTPPYPQRLLSPGPQKWMDLETSWAKAADGLMSKPAAVMGPMTMTVTSRYFRMAFFDPLVLLRRPLSWDGPVNQEDRAAQGKMNNDRYLLSPSAGPSRIKARMYSTTTPRLHHHYIRSP
jgi:hypothetical protein